MTKRLLRSEQVQRNSNLVLAAAKRVFLQRGYAGATLDAIADEAGFSKGVVYSRFGSKADLFLALLERRIEERARQNRRLAEQVSAAEAMAGLLGLEGRMSALDPRWSLLVVEFRAHAARDAELNSRYIALHERTIAELSGVLDEIHQRAGYEPFVPTELMAEMLLAIGSGLALERLARPGSLPQDELARMMTRAFGLTLPADARASV
jgi:AcrR family transcriptional regulator